MNEVEKREIRELEKELNDIYWELLQPYVSIGIAGKVQAVGFKLAKLRGYEGD